MWKWLWNWGMGISLESFEVHIRKSQDCCERTVKGGSGKDSERKESYRQHFHLLRECICNHEQNVYKNVDLSRPLWWVWDGNDEHVIRQWRKGDTFTVAKNLAGLCSCSSVVWQVEHVRDEIVCLDEISKQSVEGESCCFLTTHSKMWKERTELKRQLISTKEPEVKYLKNSQLVHIAKNEKACSKENTKGVSKQPFDKEISRGVNHRPNQLHYQKHCQF